MYRLGPPAPTVGAYAVAAPGDGAVYVSNLHVPFVTVADAETGAWVDAIDLRDAGATHAFFPRLFVDEGVLWVTAFDEDRLWRFDLATRAPLDAVVLPERAWSALAADDGVWVGHTDRLVRYAGGEPMESVPTPVRPVALAYDGARFAAVDPATGDVALLARDGTVVWTATLEEPTLNDVAVDGERVWVVDRQSGAVIALQDGARTGSVVTGSDTFEVDARDGSLYVVNRQGASLPPSGSYEGGPGRVSALSGALDVLWTVDLDKTVHFLAWDGALLWTANEDALRLSAIDPVARAEVLRGPPLGLTLDHVAERGGAYFFGSHLTDEVWRLDPATPAADALETCGWPFLVVFQGDVGRVPCQEDGDVLSFDPDTLARGTLVDVADTFHRRCDDGLCTGHSVLVGATTAQDGSLLLGDPHTASLRWEDGATTLLGPWSGDLDGVQHFDVAPLGRDVVAWSPLTATLHLVGRDGVEIVRVAGEGSAADLPLVPDGERVWAGPAAWAAGLTDVAWLDVEWTVVAAGAGWVVARDGEDVVVVDAETLEEAGRLDVDDLRVAPLRDIRGEPTPLRWRVDEAGALVVADVMRGTVERRTLPELAAIGGGAVVPLGRWAELDGLR